MAENETVLNDEQRAKLEERSESGSGQDTTQDGAVVADRQSATLQATTTDEARALMKSGAVETTGTAHLTLPGPPQRTGVDADGNVVDEEHIKRAQQERKANIVGVEDDEVVRDGMTKKELADGALGLDNEDKRKLVVADFTKTPEGKPAETDVRSGATLLLTTVGAEDGSKEAGSDAALRQLQADGGSTAEEERKSADETRDNANSNAQNFTGAKSGENGADAGEDADTTRSTSES